jgi:pyruvate dehydrogenase E2 component (dihydrolipoamide acetyltransferase)
MPTNILMPALSPTMEKGNLAKWLNKEGDPVKSGDVIAEIETDKATMEVEAVDEGTLGKILVAEGTEDVPVNQPIAVLIGEGEDPNAAAPPPPAVATPKAEAPAAAPSPAAAPKAASSVETPAAPAPQDDARQSAKTPVSKGEGGQSAQANGAGRVFVSPLARRLAKEAGIDLAALQGSGPHGRIVKSDIEEAKAGGAPRRAPAAAPAPGAAPVLAPMADDRIRALYAEGSYDLVPHDGMRKTIARRLVEAKATIPHYYLTADMDLDLLMAAREEVNSAAPKGEDGKPVWRVSVNDFIIKALALALMKVPEANVTWTEAAMLRHHSADIGVAVALPGGLITPIIRHAEAKTLSAISIEMKDLAARARARKLKPNEYEGGSSAVSNLGMYGVKEFSAVINPPHSSILAVGTAEKRAVVRAGQLAVATQMTATLSADHRAVDGALGAELLAAVRGFIEKPLSMLA